LIALQRLRVDQALLFLRHDSTVVKITAISDTNFVTQETVVPPRTARRLYRYRSLEKFDQETEAIEQGYLFCSAYDKLNDPMEGRFTSSRRFRANPDHSAIREAIIENKGRVGMCSFSEVHDHELMWRIMQNTLRVSALRIA